MASGPLVGGAVVEGLDWEWIFWLNVPIGLVAAPLVLARMRESFGPNTALDLPRPRPRLGAAPSGSSGGWCAATRPAGAAPEVVGTLALGALLVAAFVAWELRAAEPMMPMSFFRSRAFSAGNVAIFIAFASLFAAVFFFAQFLQTGLGYDVARRRPAADAVDRHVHDGRPDRRRARRPDRRAAADGRRAAAAGGRHDSGSR